MTFPIRFYQKNSALAISVISFYLLLFYSHLLLKPRLLHTLPKRRCIGPNLLDQVPSQFLIFLRHVIYDLQGLVHCLLPNLRCQLNIVHDIIQEHLEVDRNTQAHLVARVQAPRKCVSFLESRQGILSEFLTLGLCRHLHRLMEKVTHIQVHRGFLRRRLSVLQAIVLQQQNHL